MPSVITPYDMPRTPAAHRPGLKLRARVWMKEHDLDAALAGGADPARSEELTLRAKQLGERKTRDELAKAISHLITIADRQRPAIATSQPPFRTKQVQANRSLLIELARRLRGYRPVSLQGLALTSLMLEAGRGPLTTDSTPATLERAVRAALAALDAESRQREDAQLQHGMTA